ncbi:nuclear receptor ROR-alpha B-like [Paramacrobiotus metropolitanus]|uniref:nuclear receptor ROR-alpha B-like n=1 Tax=Paramacrobiotus metropolitanus TaxID=2943436 RepID=UPI002445FA5E|nr:nuclear receptor ROR-alpha B-like [Paramacrobiotus metropolitanus]
MGLDGSSTSCLPVDSCISVPRCRICGARSTGLHYGVISCEGCKAFYKRAIKNSLKYACHFGSRCVMTSKTSGRCKACRFRRCEEEGMSAQAMRQNKKAKLTTKDSGEKEKIPSPEPLTYGFREISPMSPEASMDWMAVLGLRLQRTPRYRNQADGDAEPAATGAHVLSKRLWWRELKDIQRSMQSDQSTAGEAEVSSSTDIKAIRWADPDPGARADEMPFVALNTPDAGRTHYFSGCLQPTLFPQFNMEELARSGCVQSPRFMRRYVGVVCQRNVLLRVSFDAVQAAVNSALSEQLELYKRHSETAQIHHCTAPDFDETVRTEISFFTKLFSRFVKAIPGFTDLDEQYQQNLLAERHSMFWVFFHSDFMSNKQRQQLLIFLHKPDTPTAYYCHWVCEADYMDFVVQLSTRMQVLQLSVAEKFLLFVVLLFDPVTSSFKDKRYLTLLHQHYVDVLMHVLANRDNGGDTTVMARIEQMWSGFRLFQEIVKRYVLQLDTSEMPMKLRSGQRLGDVLPSGQQLRAWRHLEPETA